MQRRETLKTFGAIGIAGALAAGSVPATGARRPQGNPGRVGTYSGNKTLVPPDLAGFDQVLVYIAEGQGHPDWDGLEGATWFHRELLGRSDEEIREIRNTAIDFHYERYGVEFPESKAGDDPFETVESVGDVEATLSPGMLDPARGYTAYVVAGKGMPNNFGDGTTNTDPEAVGHVRDATFGASIDEATELGGEYADEFGDDYPDDVSVPAGTSLPWGEYNIRMGDQEDPIHITFFPQHPVIIQGAAPSAFNCTLAHDEWGTGQVHGTTGGTMPGIRNVLTFPPHL